MLLSKTELPNQKITFSTRNKKANENSFKNVDILLSVLFQRKQAFQCSTANIAVNPFPSNIMRTNSSVQIKCTIHLHIHSAYTYGFIVFKMNLQSSIVVSGHWTLLQNILLKLHPGRTTVILNQKHQLFSGRHQLTCAIL